MNDFNEQQGENKPFRNFHPIEKKILESIDDDAEISLSELVKKTHLQIDQIRRGLEWLKFKNIISSKDVANLVSLNSMGKYYLDIGLPERRLVNAIEHGKRTISDILNNKEITKDEVNVAISKARTNKWIHLTNNKDTGQSIKLLKDFIKKSPEEELLEKIGNMVFVKELELDSRELKALELLKRRPSFISIIKDEQVLFLTPEGKSKRFIDTKDNVNSSLSKENIGSIQKLTSEMLVTGKWKEVKFRSIDVESKVPLVFPGRSNPLVELIKEIREAFVSLGFIEIEGDYIQSAFWNFDALFTPQDHAAREMQDTFYISKYVTRRIGTEKIIKNVSKAHAIGWKYRWDIKKAKKVVLRTHTTPVTLKFLSDNKLAESRIFTIGRVFRNEKMSYKHLVEFNQVEGVITSKNITLRDLMGIQMEFYKKIGIKRVKFWPTFFPYTEPSLQSMIYNDKLKKWIELFGMGIFRPEVIEPLGIKNPVLAWGGGIERIAMLRYDLSDVRDLYNNKFGWLRSVSRCLL